MNELKRDRYNRIEQINSDYEVYHDHMDGHTYTSDKFIIFTLLPQQYSNMLVKSATNSIEFRAISHF